MMETEKKQTSVQRGNAKKMKTLVNIPMHTAIQIILGIVVAIFIYLLSLWILRKDQLVSQATSTKT